MTSVADLTARFGIPGRIALRELADGFAAIEVTNDRGTASVALQGGQVLTWAPRGAEPVIWLSRAATFVPGKSIRGGVPVCWPWFGPHATLTDYPAHGFARTLPWEPIAASEMPDGRTHLALRLIQNEKTRSQWPHAAQLDMEIRVGETLQIDLCTRNTGAEPIVIGEALHTYFSISDIRRISMQGLDKVVYIDKVAGGSRQQQQGAVVFAGETDRIYIDTEADCVIDDPGLGRRIRIAKRGSRSTVVWNPWHDKAARMGDLGEDGYLGMVCVESANAADNLVSIAPQQVHRLTVEYSVE